jgi:hypothetical protein
MIAGIFVYHAIFISENVAGALRCESAQDSYL